MLNIILFGPPGSGKGTQAAHLVEKYGLVHISTGDLFRYEIGHKTKLGQEAQSYMSKGELVPDSVTIGMLKNKVNMCLDAKGFIFDGFPRTIAQAEALDAFLNDEKCTEITGLIALNVEDDEIVKRILNRGKTSGRADDNSEETIRKRIHVYNQETSPVYNYYKQRNCAYEVNGLGSLEEIFNNLCKVIDNLV